MIKKSDKFVLRNVFGKAILMPIKKNIFSDSPVLLNKTAEVIWKLSSECDDAEELWLRSCEFFGIDQDSDTENANSIKIFIMQLYSIGIFE